MKKLIAIVAAGGLMLAGAVPALAGNPNCNGNSDNVHLPHHHTAQNFPGCK